MKLYKVFLLFKVRLHGAQSLALEIKLLFSKFDLNRSTMSIAIKDIPAEIAKEAALLNPLEQQLLLTKLIVKRLKRKGIAALANPLKGIRKPTLKQIDKWKHESRIS